METNQEIDMEKLKRHIFECVWFHEENIDKDKSEVVVLMCKDYYNSYSTYLDGRRTVLGDTVWANYPLCFYGRRIEKTKECNLGFRIERKKK